MAIQKVNTQNIKQLLSKEEIIKETIEQIMKDFALFGVALHLPQTGDLAYQMIMEELSSQVTWMLSNDHSRLMSVLYQVDITEKQIRHGENDLPNYTLVEVVSHQIISRCLQKVLSRRYYKSLEE